MKGWNGCTDCRGTGNKPVPRGVASCHTRPRVVARMNGIDVDQQDLERMTACG